MNVSIRRCRKVSSKTTLFCEVQNAETSSSSEFVGAGFVQVVKKLEGQGILTFYFSGQESPGIEVWVMEKQETFLE